jgi:uncharacterized protein
VNPGDIGLLLAAGAVTGFLAGFFGIGGGIILVPILLFYYTTSLGISSLVATHLTFGTSLLIVVFASLSSAAQYSKNDLVVWRAVLLIGLASVAGAVGGAALAAGLKGKTLQQFFAAVVVAAAIRLLTESGSSRQDRPMSLSPPGLLGIGAVVGAVSSLAGVGGGVFSIPMMYSLMHFPLKKALGTSSATIVITATAAMIGYVVTGWNDSLLLPYSGFTLGYVDWLHALPVIVGTIPLAKLGARAAQRTTTDRLRKLYAVFLLLIAVRMFFFT